MSEVPLYLGEAAIVVDRAGHALALLDHPELEAHPHVVFSKGRCLYKKLGFGAISCYIKPYFQV